MRKLSLFFFALMLGLASSAFALDDPSMENVIKLHGTGASQGSSVRVIKLVRNPAGVGAATRVSGDALVYDSVSDDGVTCTVTTTSGDGTFAGILATNFQTADQASLIARDDAGRRNWGWIVVHGLATANTTAGGANNAQIGEPMITSTDAGVVTTIPNRATTNAVTTNGVEAISSGVAGFFLDADAQGTSIDVFVENV